MLSRSYFSELKRGTLDEKEFVVGPAARDRKDRVIFDDDGGKLFYDPDGRKGTKAEPFAWIDPTRLKASDFLVID